MALIPKNSVGLAGEFAVLSRLMLAGCDAGLTLGHTKGVDILAYHPETDKTYKVEVKTNLERRTGPTDSKLFGKFVTDWQMDAKHENIKASDLFYCFVHINGNPKKPKPHEFEFRFFMVPSDIVALYLRNGHRYWLQATPKGKDTSRRLSRIGLPNERPVRIPAPPASFYENNWKFRARPSLLYDPKHSMKYWSISDYAVILDNFITSLA